MWASTNHPQQFLREELGDEAERLAVELIRGHPSATLEADQALWELAQRGRQSVALRDLLLREKTPSIEEIEGAEEGEEFARAFRRYLDEYLAVAGLGCITPALRGRGEPGRDPPNAC
jgi:hypothetical protein